MSTKQVGEYSYLYGTEALNYNNYPQRMPEYEPNPTAKPAPRQKPKMDWAFALKLSLCSTILFASTFSFVYMCSILSAKQQQLKALKVEIREVKSEISNTEAIIAASVNLDHIRQRAEKELGMREPLPHQVIFIDLPKESYTVYGE